MCGPRAHMRSSSSEPSLAQVPGVGGGGGRAGIWGGEGKGGADRGLVASAVFKTVWTRHWRVGWVRFPHAPATSAAASTCAR